MSALAIGELRAAAFSCWGAMITNMDEVDVEALIELTFLIIGDHWDDFDQETAEKAVSLLKYLFKRHEPILAKYSARLPSLGNHGDTLAAIDKKVRDLQERPLDSRETFALFSQRLSHENPGVIQQALVELADF